MTSTVARGLPKCTKMQRVSLRNLHFPHPRHCSGQHLSGCREMGRWAYGSPSELEHTGVKGAQLSPIGTRFSQSSNQHNVTGLFNSGAEGEKKVHSTRPVPSASQTRLEHEDQRVTPEQKRVRGFFKLKFSWPLSPIFLGVSHKL